jgi:hypothetical protein
MALYLSNTETSLLTDETGSIGAFDCVTTEVAAAPEEESLDDGNGNWNGKGFLLSGGDDIR